MEKITENLVSIARKMEEHRPENEREAAYLRYTVMNAVRPMLKEKERVLNASMPHIVVSSDGSMATEYPPEIVELLAKWDALISDFIEMTISFHRKHGKLFLDDINAVFYRPVWA